MAGAGIILRVGVNDASPAAKLAEFYSWIAWLPNLHTFPRLVRLSMIFFNSLFWFSSFFFIRSKLFSVVFLSTPISSTLTTAKLNPIFISPLHFREFCFHQTIYRAINSVFVDAFSEISGARQGHTSRLKWVRSISGKKQLHDRRN